MFSPLLLKIHAAFIPEFNWCYFMRLPPFRKSHLAVNSKLTEGKCCCSGHSWSGIQLEMHRAAQSSVKQHTQSGQNDGRDQRLKKQNKQEKKKTNTFPRDELSCSEERLPKLKSSRCSDPAVFQLEGSSCQGQSYRLYWNAILIKFLLMVLALAASGVSRFCPSLGGHIAQPQLENILSKKH